MVLPLKKQMCLIFYSMISLLAYNDFKILKDEKTIVELRAFAEEVIEI